MVFDGDAEMGVGVVVPCKEEVRSLTNLVEEAKALWGAEQPGADPSQIGANWGCVGMALHRAADAEALIGWGDYFRKHTKPQDPVNKDGILKIEWPTTLNGNEVDIDILLGTANRRALSRPTSDQVASAWVGQNQGFEEYFFENIRNGIRTSEDLAIWHYFEIHKPEWLANPCYAGPIATLRQDAAGGSTGSITQ